MDRPWTADEVRALPIEPGKRFEVVDGELLVTPAPSRRHQHVVLELAVLLRSLVHASPVGTVLIAPSDYDLDEHTLVQPDLYVLPASATEVIRGSAESVAAILFVEVLSPSTARHDRVVKRLRYQRAGIEYWLVDSDARVFERWMPGAQRPDVIDEQFTWQPPGIAAPTTVDVAEFFDQALGPAAGIDGR